MGVSGTVISFDEALQAASEGNTSREAASALVRAKPGAEFDLLAVDQDEFAVGG